MARRGYRGRVFGWVTALAVGGTAFGLGGCDPAVRGSLLTGLQTTTSALADTLVSAFFLSLQDNTSQTGTTTLTGQTP